jgi:hypothetical protein
MTEQEQYEQKLDQDARKRLKQEYHDTTWTCPSCRMVSSLSICMNCNR